ncbi:Metallo-hydrolase/oxidoreductase [Sparassis latifolia]
MSIAAFIVWVVAGAIIVFDLPVQSTPSSKSSAQPPRGSAFSARRLTPTTFLIVETDDVFGEQPFIYAKLVPAANTLVLLDTGCGGRSRDHGVEITSLREFIETVPVTDNGGRPLNERARLRYVVVLSHCHYDHILGVEDFAHDSPILESAHSPTFVSRANLPAHSQCARLGVPTPTFTPTLVPHNTPLLSASGVPVGLTLLHTPGHTPDELALWDAVERVLYAGDTLYERAPIIFPAEGDIAVWLASLSELIDRVCAESSPQDVRICCGHETAGRPALDVLRTAEAFVRDVLDGRELVRSREERWGVWVVEYMQEGGRYSLVCPERLVLEAREKIGLNV